MLFLLSGSLFASERVKSADLLALLRGAAIRGHTVFVVDDPYDFSGAESKEFERWADRLNTALQREVTWLRERIRRISPNAVARGATTIIVEERKSPRVRGQVVALRLVEAVRLATLPLFVLVENGLNDAAFVRKTMPPPWRRKISEWERAGTLRFEHAGGIGEMKKIVEYCAAGGGADPLGLGPSVWRLSHIILCDRDSQDQNGQPSQEARSLQSACRRADMAAQLHVLKRRDQESYLPKEALWAIVSTKSGKQEREDMRLRLENHFALASGRHHVPLPKTGEISWFKNAFLFHGSSFAWDDAWFANDESAAEMVELAEMIAAFL